MAKPVEEKPTLCTDSDSNNISVCVVSEPRVITVHGPEMWEAWLAKLPAGATLLWQTTPEVVPIRLGIPTTQVGRDLTKRAAGWMVPETGSVAASSVGVHGTWQPITHIAPHASRWMPYDGSGEPTLCGHAEAIIADGYIIRLTYDTTWSPEGSCLFEQFFHENIRPDLAKVREKVHKTKSMSIGKVGGGHAFEGILLPCKLRLDGHTRFAQKQTFKVIRPDRSEQVVNVY